MNKIYEVVISIKIIPMVQEFPYVFPNSLSISTRKRNGVQYRVNSWDIANIKGTVWNGTSKIVRVDETVARAIEQDLPKQVHYSFHQQHLNIF